MKILKSLCILTLCFPIAGPVLIFAKIAEVALNHTDEIQAAWRERKKREGK